MDRRFHDRVSLELASIVAAGLRTHPEWLEFAKGNIRRWSERNSGAPGLLRCYAEWAEILDRPLEAITATLLDSSDRGQRLRTNSPFAGVIGAREVWEIKRRVREELNAEPDAGRPHDQSAA